MYGVKVSAFVTSTEVSVIAPVRVLKLVTAPDVPLEIAVTRPFASTVTFAFV